MKGEGTVKGIDSAPQHSGRVLAEFTTHSRLAAIVEGSDDAIFALDLDGIITDWNHAAERIFGYTSEEIVGNSVSRIIPPDRQRETDAIAAKVRQGAHTGSVDTLLRRNGGTLIDVSLTMSPISDESGAIVGISAIARDTTSKKQQEQELARVTRLYSALSQINQAIVRIPTREDLFNKICEVLVEHGEFDLAWIGWYDADTKRIAPVAAYGREKDYLETVEVFGDDRPTGNGPMGKAFRSGESYVCNDLIHDPNTIPWQAKLAAWNLQSTASFPIREKSTVRGALAVYAHDPRYFAEKEVALLNEAAGDISFAIENLAEREVRLSLEKMAERERHFSEAMIESMPGIVYFIDSNGRLVRWNSNFEAVTGYSSEEIARMDPLDVFAPEEQELVRGSLNEAREKGDSFAEVSLTTKNGRTVPYYFIGRRTVFNDKSCLVGMGIDISRSRAAESELNEARMQLQCVVDNLQEGLVVADDQRGILQWNPASLQMLGFSNMEEGRRRQRDFDEVFELFALDGTQIPPERWPLARVRGGEWIDNLELRVRRIGSNWERLFSYTGSLRSYAGGGKIAYMTIRDITDQKRAQLELQSLNQMLEDEVAIRTMDLQSALARAESADRVKSTFLATMSHELRTPLNTIIGFTGVLLQGLSGALNAEQTKQLGMVRKSARHLLELISDVLDISKIEADQFEVRFEPFELSTAIDGVMDLMRDAAEEKGLSFEVVIDSGVNVIVSDRRRVEQILLNLLNNAVKFTDHGGVSMRVKCEDSYLFGSATITQSAVRISVSDTGPGIRSEDMGSLFEPFKQLDTGTQRRHEGTGLGLAICYRLTGLLGGELLAKSEWQKGSEFTLVLPRERITDE